MKASGSSSPHASVLILFTSVAAFMALGAWIGIVLLSVQVWIPWLILALTILLGLLFGWIFEDVRTCFSGQKQVNRSRLFSEISLIFLLILVVGFFYYPSWTWLLPDLPDINFHVGALQLSYNSGGPELDIFPNFWVVWGGLMSHYLPQYQHFSWFLIAILGTVTLLLYIGWDQDQRVSLQVCLIIMASLPALLSSKGPFPGLAAGFLFWAGMLSLRRGLQEQRLFSLFQAALCLREAIFLFFPFVTIVLSVPLLLIDWDREKPSFMLWSRCPRRFFFMVILFLLVFERLVWFGIMHGVTGKLHQIYGSWWLPNSVWSQFFVVLILFVFILMLLVSLSPSRIKHYLGRAVMTIIFSIVFIYFSWSLLSCPSDGYSFYDTCIKNNSGLKVILFLSNVGLLLWLFEKGDSIRYWLITLFGLQLSLIPVYFSQIARIGHILFILPFILPMFFVGLSVVLSFIGRLGQGHFWSWVVTLILFFLGVLSSGPLLSIPWGEDQQKTLRETFKNIPSEAYIYLNRDDTDLLGSLYSLHQGPIDFSSESKVFKSEKFEEGKIYFVLNLPSRLIFEMADHITIQRGTGYLYLDPIPLRRPDWQPRILRLEQIVHVSQVFEPLSKKSVPVEIIDIGNNDRGLVNNFHKREFAHRIPFFRWTTNQSYLKIPTLEKKDYKITFVLVNRNYPAKRQLRLVVKTEQSGISGVITRQRKSIILAQAVVTPPFTRLILETETFCPGKNKRRGDKRQLGVPIDKIKITY
ncbi:hypothetical protein ACFL27_22225 [candidate division CSSED10-310 bacterium]|uniref:Glycosyltransferase RgtA/B/C/D-like domain-containing protein n=1 Tax=candidate division CSSED10-310 bacterium TaxID=2855610 RepID=A0ABV6Z396_UNCC1